MYNYYSAQLQQKKNIEAQNILKGRERERLDNLKA